MKTITRNHPDFNAVLDTLIDIMQDRGMEISNVEAFKAGIPRLIISGGEVLIPLPKQYRFESHSVMP